MCDTKDKGEEFKKSPERREFLSELRSIFELLYLQKQIVYSNEEEHFRIRKDLRNSKSTDCETVQPELEFHVVFKYLQPFFNYLTFSVETCVEIQNDFNDEHENRKVKEHSE